jgi:hypothetical protein
MSYEKIRVPETFNKVRHPKKTAKIRYGAATVLSSKIMEQEGLLAYAPIFQPVPEPVSEHPTKQLTIQNTKLLQKIEKLCQVDCKDRPPIQHPWVKNGVLCCTDGKIGIRIKNVLLKDGYYTSLIKGATGEYGLMELRGMNYTPPGVDSIFPKGDYISLPDFWEDMYTDICRWDTKSVALDNFVDVCVFKKDSENKVRTSLDYKYAEILAKTFGRLWQFEYRGPMKPLCATVGGIPDMELVIMPIREVIS